MKAIIVPINFTGNCLNAAKYATDMALAIQAEVYLLHVVKIPFSTSEESVSKDVFDEMLKSAAEDLADWSQELNLRTKGEVRIFTSVQYGTVEFELEEFCIQKNPFAIVMGIASPSLTRAWLGSTSLHAIQHMRYPVIIVPENAAFHLINKIVLACDLEDVTAGISMDFLKELGNTFHASFDVININTEKQDREAEVIFGMNSWKQRFKELHTEVHFIKNDSVGEGVEKFLESRAADLLMVFPKDHSFLEFHSSRAKQIVSNSPIPVMSVHM